MKTNLITFAGMAILAVSCTAGPGKDELVSDVNAVCKCFNDSKNDSKKFIECSGKNETTRNKYLDYEEMLADYDQRLTTCIAGN